ncbi:MAG: type II secretion system protein [Burkholderiales bacterium]
MKTSGQGGFTLVEIAIVLVIVGLLLAAVMKGQEMITQGKIKGTISDFNSVLTAYNGYQDRYKAIPGDDSAAAARWPTGAFGTDSVAAVNGNGDGVIAGLYSTNLGADAAPTTTQESNLFWQHLRAAGFYAGIQTGNGSGTLPTNSVGGTIGVENDTTSTAGIRMGGILICLTSIPEKIATAVDRQIDDGDATMGSVRSLAIASATPVVFPVLASAAPAAYVSGSSYVMCRSVL